MNRAPDSRFPQPFLPHLSGLFPAMALILAMGLVLGLAPALSARTVYVAPGGTGNGASAASPLGTLAAGMQAIAAGDTLLLLDGEYREALNINKSGTADKPLTIRAQNVGGAFLNGEGARIPITALNRSYIHLDGLRAGNSSEHVYHILWGAHFRITRCAGFNAGGAQRDDANFHIFEIGYSTDMFVEDVWAWGTGRYAFTFYGCSRSHLRRGVFRPGFYRAAPHAGLAVYCSDSTLVENVIAFEARIDPASGYGGTEPYKLITGGFVCEGHDCPDNKSSKDNRMLGCIGIDNGQLPAVTPRSQPAGCFIWNEYGGVFEDWVLWKNADKAFSAFTDSSTRVMPARSLEGDPSRILRNTGPRILTRYVDGLLGQDPLWPWPYEELIKRDMGMSETITEYVRRQLAPQIAIPGGGISIRWEPRNAPGRIFPGRRTTAEELRGLTGRRVAPEKQAHGLVVEARGGRLIRVGETGKRPGNPGEDD